MIKKHEREYLRSASRTSTKLSTNFHSFTATTTCRFAHTYVVSNLIHVLQYAVCTTG